MVWRKSPHAECFGSQPPVRSMPGGPRPPQPDRSQAERRDRASTSCLRRGSSLPPSSRARCGGRESHRSRSTPERGPVPPPVPASPDWIAASQVRAGSRPSPACLGATAVLGVRLRHVVVLAPTRGPSWDAPAVDLAILGIPHVCARGVIGVYADGAEARHPAGPQLVSLGDEPPIPGQCRDAWMQRE